MNGTGPDSSGVQGWYSFTPHKEHPAENVVPSIIHLNQEQHARIWEEPHPCLAPHILWNYTDRFKGYNIKIIFKIYKYKIILYYLSYYNIKCIIILYILI